MHKIEKEFYCFDCDGVLWRGKEPIVEARDLLIKLKKAVKYKSHSHGFAEFVE